MARDDRNVTGPFLCILACLFVLSVTARRSWERQQTSPLETSATASQPAAPQMAEPSTLARTTDVPNEHVSNKIDTPNPEATEPGEIPTEESLTLADIPDVVTVSQDLPYDPGRFTETLPADRYTDQASVVSMPSLEPPAVETPRTSTLARQVAPHEEVAESPLALEPPEIESPSILASLPERTGPELRGIPLSQPVSEAIGSKTLDDETLNDNTLNDNAMDDELIVPHLPELSAEIQQSDPAVPDAEVDSELWSEPETLLESIAEVADLAVTSRWAAETSRLVRDLGPAVAKKPVTAHWILEHLWENHQEVDPLPASLGSPAEATRLRRIGHALRRRLDIWQRVTAIDDLASRESGGSDVQPAGDPKQLSLALAEIDAITGNSAEGEAWRDYLMFDALHEWTLQHTPPTDGRIPRDLAQQVFGRLTQTPVSVAQREFMTSRPMTALRAQLQPWAAEPVPSSRLLTNLERYEQTELESDARRLATDCLYLGLAEDQPHRDLAGQLQIHYRNANLRVAITEALMNRLMPEREPEYASVRDRVLDVAVRGKSMTSTDVAIRLQPDPQQVRVALEVKGRVATVTHSTTGPITFYNDGDAVYTARKPLEIDLGGIRPGRTEVQVSNDVRLRRMETDFDEIPLVGSLVQEVARGQHEMNQDAARREIRAKMAAQARRRTDSEADARFGELSERLRNRIIDPLEALALDPTIIDAETTAQRITMRLRLAGKDQLASHTPRPRAPGGSLASLQVHQSAVNNLSDRFELAGNTYTL
ncbi:MAG TPA: hypothetical protein VE890_11670, partial [Thermoguttaceae bacterium]|nr:hypothetical protein [Thermoguttaceae bacterium]